MQPNSQSDAIERLRAVERNISVAIPSSGDENQQVTLVAVSKTFAAEDIQPILKAGHRVFGENRVQEAAGKWPLLRNQYENIQLHLIGPLQTNKTAAAVEMFDCIETLDRPKLAKSISAELQKTNKVISLFIQVNTGNEPQKAGISVEGLPAFLDFCQGELSLNISGLMCIPPRMEPPEKHFKLLAALANAHDLENLSMGMSADYQQAVKCGATHVRVGSAIFGAR